MAVAEPIPRPRPRTRTRKRVRRASARGGILWIAIGGILLAGVVFVNVAVLQLNLRLDSANAERSKLLAENAALQTQYAQLISSPRVSAAATKQLGLVYKDPSQYGYVDLAGK
ncbi:MAG TPA: cell division protein FtsL [Gaiellaceae bacterium]|jgi:cell division protein FtsL|nr:cell division protein FtsL [Gaiellaceae bacterium]